MTRRLLALLALSIALPVPVLADAVTPVRRYALVVGANFGGADRPMLKYAVTDAERFARVIADLGGVNAEDNLILKQPKLRDLLDGLDLLTRRVAEGAKAAGPNAPRSEIIVYYSGHADEKGLLLGEDRYSYRTLRDRLDQIPADVRIAVLDACASGAFTRAKGGRKRPAFLVDQSTSMRGHAFLTSSAATEVAQESDRIRASYFTHYLVSGLRGAADLSGDGRITLNEAYQFAFHETLGRTVDTKGGAQHPSYDINMSGTGDIVMTDVRQLSATLVLGADVDGRFFVRNAAQELIVEVYKPAGRSVELGVEPGAYDVRVERERSVQAARLQVADGSRVVVDRAQLTPTRTEPTRTRGDVEPLRLAVAGRNRVELRFGMWQTAVASARPVVSAGNTASDLFAGLQYTRYVSERVAVSLGIEAAALQSGATVTADSVFAGNAGLVAMPVGVRWNPLKRDQRMSAMKPFLAGGIGPVFGGATGSFAGARGTFAGTQESTTVGGFARAGADFHVARSFTIGIDGGYNWMADFSTPIGARTNYSGFQLGLGLGWVFGRGVAHP